MSDKSMKHVEIYTDGACSGNPGPGGWGAILRHNGREKELSGGEMDTTNNRMEMTAVIMALSALKHPCRVDLYTDSQYVRSGVLEWMPKWKATNWKKNIKNRDLWERIDSLNQTHKITWHWVKGHTGHPENERADVLATSAIPKS